MPLSTYFLLVAEIFLRLRCIPFDYRFSLWSLPIGAKAMIFPSLTSFFRITRGDISGIAYLVTNNIVNYLIVILTLSQGLHWPNYIVYGRVIPGMSIGLMAGGFYYAYMAWKLSQKTGSREVTALPSGVSTPAMFVILYGVVTPLHYALDDPEKAWAAATAACLIGGGIEFIGGLIGPWMKRKLPRAALLGTVAGIGFIWMATQGLFDIFYDPIIGMPIMVVAMMGLFGGYLFPGKIPPLVIAIIGGIVYAFALGRSSFDFTGIGMYFPNPVNIFESLSTGFTLVVPYLTIVIPVEIYNFIETMDNVEAANVAGDEYSVREAQFADGICTMVSALFGGIIPNTVWLGHAGLKKEQARIAYSWISGLILGVAGCFGLFSLLNSLVPPAICAITFLWCAIIMLCQAFKATKPKHYAAVAIAMIPAVADFIYNQTTAAVGVSDTWTKTLSSGLPGYAPDITDTLIHNGAIWNGVPAVKCGAIIIGLLLSTLTVCIIDHQLDKAALVCTSGAVMSLFGLIHAAELHINWSSPFFIGYMIMASLCFVLHLGRNTWYKAPKGFEYV